MIGRLGLIEDVDDAFCALVGYERAELLTMHGSDLVPTEQRPAVAVSAELMRAGRARLRTGELKRRDGSLVRIEVEANPLAGDRLEMTIRVLSEPARAG